MIELKNEASKQLNKLNIKIGVYSILVVNENNETELFFDVIGFPTRGVYHLKFTKLKGSENENLKPLLNHDSVSFNVQSIDEQGIYTSIFCKELTTNSIYQINNIQSITMDMRNEGISVTAEDIMNNEIFQKNAKANWKSQHRLANQTKGFSILKWFGSKIK